MITILLSGNRKGIPFAPSLSRNRNQAVPCVVFMGLRIQGREILAQTTRNYIEKSLSHQNPPICTLFPQFASALTAGPASSSMMQCHCYRCISQRIKKGIKMKPNIKKKITPPHPHQTTHSHTRTRSLQQSIPTLCLCIFDLIRQRLRKRKQATQASERRLRARHGEVSSTDERVSNAYD